MAKEEFKNKWDQNIEKEIGTWLISYLSIWNIHYLKLSALY